MPFILQRLEKIFETAVKEIGVKRGEQHQDTRLPSNPVVLNYFKDAGHPEVHHDAESWCAAFVGAILHRAGEHPSGSLLARSYLAWGRKIDGPLHGCIVVFERGPSMGHVAFYDRLNKDRTIRCLGGNQTGNSEVCFEDFPVHRVLGYRVPS